MANESFDITTGCDLQEVDNAVNQALKEITGRFDFKGVLAEIEFERGSNKIKIHTTDEYKLDADQKARLKTLLANRRQEFLDLIDTTPAPSVRLSSLAPVVGRLAQPGDAKADAAKSGNKPDAKPAPAAGAK